MRRNSTKLGIHSLNLAILRISRCRTFLPTYSIFVVIWFLFQFFSLVIIFYFRDVASIFLCGVDIVKEEIATPISILQEERLVIISLKRNVDDVRKRQKNNAPASQFQFKVIDLIVKICIRQINKICGMKACRLCECIMNPVPEEISAANEFLRSQNLRLCPICVRKLTWLSSTDMLDRWQKLFGVLSQWYPIWIFHFQWHTIDLFFIWILNQSFFKFFIRGIPQNLSGWVKGWWTLIARRTPVWVHSMRILERECFDTTILLVCKTSWMRPMQTSQQMMSMKLKPIFKFRLICDCRKNFISHVDLILWFLPWSGLIFWRLSFWYVCFAWYFPSVLFILLCF